MILVTALPPLSLALFAHAVPIAVAFFVAALASDQFGVAWDVSLQQNVPADKLARVYSYDMLGSLIAIPLGQVAVGPLAEIFGTRVTLIGPSIRAPCNAAKHPKSHPRTSSSMFLHLDARGKQSRAVESTKNQRECPKRQRCSRSQTRDAAHANAGTPAPSTLRSRNSGTWSPPPPSPRSPAAPARRLPRALPRSVPRASRM
jgi:hypothetical protein